MTDQDSRTIGGHDDAQPTAINAELTELIRNAVHDGPVWSHASDDLNINLVVLHSGHTIAEHVNSEVDVFLVGVDGRGSVSVDGRPHELSSGRLIVIPKGAARSIAPESERVAYITCHKRRRGLWPQVRR